MIIPQWILDLFQAIDRRNSDKFAGFLTDNATFKFGNAEAVEGKVAVKEAVGAFFESIKALDHKLIEAWEFDDTVICRGEATYTRHDGSKLTVPFANIFKMKSKLVDQYLIYVDVSMLYQTAQ